MKLTPGATVQIDLNSIFFFSSLFFPLRILTRTRTIQFYFGFKLQTTALKKSNKEGVECCFFGEKKTNSIFKIDFR